MAEEAGGKPEREGAGLFRHLGELKAADLPPRTKPFWKMVGPGAVMVGLSIGAGELIIWPRIAAEYGHTMLWAAMLGLFLQLWINFEVGRYTIATGETVFTGFARIWCGFVPIFILLTILGWFAPGWARASGGALKALLVGVDGWGSDTAWTCITFAIVSLVLFGPKMVYQSVEKTTELLVLMITIGLIVVAFAVGTIDTWKQVGDGLFLSFGQIAPGFSTKQLFSGIVFAGAGGTANLFYSFYLRDKKIGMGQRVPSLMNPLRGRAEAVPDEGYAYPDTEENAAAFKSWFGFVVKDQALFFFGLNLLTMMLFIFGALAVLHPRGIVPAAGQLVWDEAVVLGEVWGKTGRTIFLLVGFATLFSTQMTLVDGVSRSIADLVYTNVRAARKRDLNWWYMMVAFIWIIGGCWITYIMEHRGVSELGFLFNTGVMGGFAMALYCPLMLIMNHKYLPLSARPKLGSTVMMVIASIVYIGFAVVCVLTWGR